VILYPVPLWLDLDKSTDVLGNDLASYCSFTKKASLEDTGTEKLKF